jgi:hypothetical protein
VRHPHLLPQLPLERIDVRTERRDPVLVEGLEEERAFKVAHVRGR